MVTNVLKTPTMSLEAVDIRVRGLSLAVNARVCAYTCVRAREQGRKRDETR